MKPAVLCPVCADILAGATRSCDRCATPHHPECWDYLPGCAVFACEEQASSLAVSRWPLALRLLLWRSQLAVISSWGLLAGTGGFASGVFLQFFFEDTTPKFLGLWGALSILVFAVGVMAAAAWFFLSGALYLKGGTALRERVQGQGDRRLQAAMERKIHAPTFRWAAGSTALLSCLVTLGACYNQTRHHPITSLSEAVLQILAMGLVWPVFFSVLGLPIFLGSALVARERTIANRLRVALPEKPSR